MKIILTIDQIKKLLANEPVKLPITFQVGRIKKTEIEELIEILKKKKKD